MFELPDNLPVPEDDGACAHLEGKRLPPVSLLSTRGRQVHLGEFGRGKTVLFFYPRTGVPGEPVPVEWDETPGARGCTPQSCGYRDLLDEFERLGVCVYGVSTQTTAFQQEFAARMHIPYEILSDEKFLLTDALSLPTFVFAGERLLKRMAWVVENGVIAKVFYPVFPPDRNATEVLTWLRKSPRL